MTRQRAQERHVAFDWGGVLTLGTFDERATRHIARRSGQHIDVVRQSYFANVHNLELGVWTLTQFWETFQREAEINLHYSEFEALYLGSIHDNAAMFATLAGLPTDVRVGLLSNNYPVISDHLRGDPRFSRFDALVFSNELGCKKPSTRAFAELAKAMRLPPPQVMFVDDAEENVAAADRFGFRGFHYRHADHEAFHMALSEWLGL